MDHYVYFFMSFLLAIAFQRVEELSMPNRTKAMGISLFTNGAPPFAWYCMKNTSIAIVCIYTEISKEQLIVKVLKLCSCWVIVSSSMLISQRTIDMCMRHFILRRETVIGIIKSRLKASPFDPLSWIALMNFLT